MRALRKGFPESERVQFLNSSGSTITSDEFVDLGGLGWGIAITDVLDGNTGVATRRGHMWLPKVAAVAFVAGQAVGWDGTNKEVIAATGGKPIGAVVTAALAADTKIMVDLNQPAESYRNQGGGSAAAGLQVDLGFGVVPTGPVIVQSTTSAGVPRAFTSVTLDTAGDAGKITITTTAGAADDIHHIIAHRE